jgi:hypothetical protein
MRNIENNEIIEGFLKTVAALQIMQDVVQLERILRELAGAEGTILDFSLEEMVGC